MKILACGPYIGDFEQEVLTFRPYCRWLQKVVEHDSIYINTHINRKFLYDFIPEDNFIPVYEDLSRDELEQKGYIHNSIKRSNYNILLKKFKDEIIKKENCNKKEILQYNLNYIKSTPALPIYNKYFEKIKSADDIEIKEKIVFIPHKNRNYEEIFSIYENFKDKYDCVIIGDLTSEFPENNILSYKIDYFENGWKYIINYINKAKAVICPVSFWVAICNLQGVNTFSWGESVSQYKNTGIYYFNNDKLLLIPYSEDSDISKMITMVGNYLERL